MKNNPALFAVSPLDGRYRKECEEVAAFFSEYALIKYRVLVEVKYFSALCSINLPQLKDCPKSVEESLERVLKNFSEEGAERVKEIEKTTNHDVKAVEYFLKEKLNGVPEKFTEFIHFGLTSQDVNNTSLPLMLKDFLEQVYLPQINALTGKLVSSANEWKKIAMLSRTHGQPASPTLLGKEIMVFTERIRQQLDLLSQVPHTAKFGGATGNFNAHYAAYPDVNWMKIANEFIESLGLKRQQFTTQIEHYDNLAAILDTVKRINVILLDFSRDVWQYISMNYFSQKIVKGEIGSSAMPHKVNPINFENAEGNLGIANALFEHISSKLPVSRLQRDLTDSTVTRNIGVPFAHSVIAIKAIIKGMEKIIVNEQVIKNDLEENWIIISEAIQTVLRREGYPKPYEALKELTRTGEKITAAIFEKFIDNLDVDDTVKTELKKITPFNYTGPVRDFTF